MKKALRVSPSGVVSEIDLDKRGAVAHAVGGRASSRNLSLMLTVWANTENGDAAPNAVAAHIFRSMYRADVAVPGDVVFTGAEDEEGEFRALAAGWERNIRTVADTMKKRVARRRAVG